MCVAVIASFACDCVAYAVAAGAKGAVYIASVRWEIDCVAVFNGDTMTAIDDAVSAFTAAGTTGEAMRRPLTTESRLLNACAGAAIPALRIAVVAGFCVGALAITANRCCLAILGAAVAVICVAVVALFTGERVEETITAEGERAVGIAACTLQAPSITLLAAIQNTISAQIDDAFAAIFIFLIAVAKSLKAGQHRAQSLLAADDMCVVGEVAAQVAAAAV